MTITLELPPDVEAGLLAQAHTHGLPLEDYLIEHVLRGAVEKTQSPQRPAGRKSLVELFEPLRGLDLDFSRNPSTGRPVDL